jgi:hypothetical protein
MLLLSWGAQSIFQNWKVKGIEGGYAEDKSVECQYKEVVIPTVTVIWLALICRNAQPSCITPRGDGSSQPISSKASPSLLIHLYMHPNLPNLVYVWQAWDSGDRDIVWKWIENDLMDRDKPEVYLMPRSLPLRTGKQNHVITQQSDDIFLLVFIISLFRTIIQIKY